MALTHLQTHRFETYAALRQQLAGDPQRPVYHFLPPANWINDPNGLIQWQGRYHLFYQHNPGAAIWGDIHWGHAVSDDLVHWQDLPLALAPTPGGYDADGVWSGCAVDDGGTPTLIYTARLGEGESVCLAHGDADLVTWEKDARNPVIAGPPPGLQTTGFRDPYVWRMDDGWYMVIGSGIEGQGGAVLLYRSPDLCAWEYLGPLFLDEGQYPDTMWECPNFFPLEGRWVLLGSVLGGTGVRYWVGDFDGWRFTPTQQGWVDAGEYFFAPLTFADSAGRRLLYGWLEAARSDAALLAAGWGGVLTLPRVLSLDANDALVSQPAPEVTTLRGPQLTGGRLPALSGEVVVICEIDDQPCGVQLVEPRTGDALVQAVYRPALGQLALDARQGCEPNVHGACQIVQTALAMQPGERLTLRIFLDRSLVEVFANDRRALTARFYPKAAEGAEVRPVGKVQQLDLWAIPSIW